MLYGLVYLVDSRFESFAGKAIVFTESFPKIFELTLEIRNIDGLFLRDGKLLSVLQALFGRLHQEGYHRNEKLRTNHIHLIVSVGHIHNTAVVQLVVRFQQRDEYGKFATFGPAIGIQFLEKIFVLMLRGGLIGFVLHLEHDGYVFSPIFAEITKDKVPFRASRCIIIFFEIGIGHHGAEHLIELGGAMNL